MVETLNLQHVLRRFSALTCYRDDSAIIALRSSGRTSIGVFFYSYFDVKKRRSNKKFLVKHFVTKTSDKK